MLGDPSQSLDGRRILVVEDEWIISEYLREELVGRGAILLGPVASVQQALELLEAEPRPDIAVLDVRLRGELVFPVARELRQRGIPFVFASAGEWFDLPREWSDELYLQKPMKMEDLLPLLAHL